MSVYRTIGPLVYYYYCSAGIGRTGTFIVLDMLTFEGEDRGSVDIFGSVVSLRNQRCNMVQTPVSLFPDHIWCITLFYIPIVFHAN